MLRLAVVAFSLAQHFALADENWGYSNTADGELDPSHWYQINKNCIGDRQSPIDIEKDVLEYSPDLHPIIFEGYNELIDVVNITNEGHTVRVDVPEKTQAYLRSRSFNTTYKLKQFHFHWGQDDTVGSEHVVFGRHYPLEMHLVHADATVDYNTALLEPFGLAVVSVLYKYGRENFELRRITNHLPLIRNPERKTVTIVNWLNLQLLLPHNVNNYLQYDGSLTTPPCSESVKWIILTDTGEISRTQMFNFRSLLHEIVVNGQEVLQPYETNDRPVQGINGRVVQFRYDFDDLSN